MGRRRAYGGALSASMRAATFQEGAFDPLNLDEEEVRCVADLTTGGLPQEGDTVAATLILPVSPPPYPLLPHPCRPRRAPPGR